MKFEIGALVFCIFNVYFVSSDDLQLTDKEVLNLRSEVKEMFYHAYEGYMKYAIPYDELRPLTCDGHDTWGSYSLTLIDALDTLAVMGNQSEFERVHNLILERRDFEADINVSVFETNIRIVGGLLSGHLMSRRMGIPLEEGWPCTGPLLRLAVDAATRLLPAFDTPTGMPYGTVNLRFGVPDGETPITCSAGVGTFIIEFGVISRLTGDPVFEEVALRAMHALWSKRSRLDLIGNHINVLTGKWTGSDAGIGAGVDSFFEYLAKGSFLFQRPELMGIFKEARRAIDKYLKHEDWYLWKTIERGQISMAVFQSLESFWPGVLTLVGDVAAAQKTLFNYHQVQKQYGFTPEFYSIPQGSAYAKRSGYPLRPEFVESLMYLYQATKDHTFLKMGADLLKAIQHSAKTDCGYATVLNVADHTLDNRMESFFLAETTKYLYLLFHEDHWLHSSGNSGHPHKAGNRHCVVDAGGYFFNTEAHPIDAGTLACCSGPDEENFAFSQEDLVGLILDPTQFLAHYEGASLLQQSTAKLKETSAAEKVYSPILVDDENDDLSEEGVGEVTLITKEPVEEVTIVTEEPVGEVTMVREPVGDVTVVTKEPVGEVTMVKEPVGDVTIVTKEPVGEVTMLRESLPKPEEANDLTSDEDEDPPTHAGEIIAVEKDRNKSEYEGRVTDLLGTLEANRHQETEPTPWGPRFSPDTNQTPHQEMVEASPSVSSSKFPPVGKERIVEKESPVEEKPQQEKTFSLDDLRETAREEVLLLQKMAKGYSYSLLSCPVSFIENFHFKGQMIVET